MRLRYLHIPDLAPLKNITIIFGHEPILGRECTLHFIVGVNGTGKSRLLRALAEIFLSLETGDVPPFPVTIAYDLGKRVAGEQEDSQSQRTVYYRYTGGGMASAYMVELKPIPLDAENIAWEHLHEIDWESSDHPLKLKRQYYSGNDTAIKSYLPSYVLAYTSGAPDEWETTFAFPVRDLEENIELPPVEQDQEIRRAMEYPPTWNNYKRATSQQSQREEDQTKHSLQSKGKELFPGENLFPGEDLFPRGGQSSGIGIFIQPHMLKLVICAVALSQVLEEFKERPTEPDRESFAQNIENAIKNKQRMGGLRDLLNEVDWLWPVTIGLRITFRAEQFNKDQLKLLTRAVYKRIELW